MTEKQSPTMSTNETCRWSVERWDGNRTVVIVSNDYTHDAVLIVTGDFSDDEQRLAYAWMIADRLNAATVPQEK